MSFYFLFILIYKYIYKSLNLILQALKIEIKNYLKHQQRHHHFFASAFDGVDT